MNAEQISFVASKQVVVRFPPTGGGLVLELEYWEFGSKYSLQLPVGDCFAGAMAVGVDELMLQANKRDEAAVVLHSLVDQWAESRANREDDRAKNSLDQIREIVGQLLD